jgi:hypothetical protein
MPYKKAVPAGLLASTRTRQACLTEGLPESLLFFFSSLHSRITMDEPKQPFDTESAGLELSISENGELQSVPPNSPKPKVHFNLAQTLGMNYSISAAPISIGVYTALVIGLGGFPFYIWAFVVAAFFQLITCVAVAEIASAIPHSSGEFYLLFSGRCTVCPNHRSVHG